MLACAGGFTTAQAQEVGGVNRQKYPDYTPELKPDYSLMQPKSTRVRDAAQRPDHVNNALTPYFPPVFNQDGGSCGSASRIGYMFNYEINAFRGLDGSLEENQYPTHFTWLLTNSNSGKETMAAANGIPNVPTYGGRTYSRLFGNQDCADPDFGWMQGYDKWYAAMCNRITSNGNFPVSVATEEGREAVKNWLWNHNGDPDFKAGGICGIGLASGGTWVQIPSTDVNDSIGVTNMYYVKNWGAQVDHALTIVGYDDRIEFDLDGNGIAGEKDKDEVGAWIIVNSWGDGWCNNGFIYCPYKNAVTTGDGTTSTDYYYPEVYYVRKNYRPLRTFKILMEYSKRSELRISGGISADLNADKPDKMINFEHFKFAGDGNGDGVDAEVPMLGRWADGMHYEPMEFGYDMTDLSAGFDTRRPLKYFLVIETKAGASGSGKVDAFSAIDYEFDENGVEFPAELGASGIEIKNNGQTTYVSVILPGEPFNAPQNLQWNANALQWDAPAASSYKLLSYRIYQNGALIDSVAAGVLTYTPEGQGDFTVSALYAYGDSTIESAQSNTPAGEFSGTSPNLNYVRTFNQGGFNIEDVFNERYEQATIEFWIKPTSVRNWNQQIGPAWGKFMMHTTSSAELVVGWDTGNRITSAANTLRTGQWAHVAVVVNKGEMTAYVNGQSVGSISSGYSGLGGFGDLNVGLANSANGLSCNMDEFRIWNRARTQKEIQQYMYAEINNPSTMPGLLVELSMDDAANEAPTDAAQGHTITLLGTNEQTRILDFNVLKDPRELTAGFELPDGPYMTETPIYLANTSSGNATKWIWTAESSNLNGTNVEQPSVTFTEAGQHVISLKVFNAKGDSAVFEDTVTVEALGLPQADFKIYPDTLPAGENVSLINLTTPATGCTYKWSMPNAVVTESDLVNTSTRYLKAGTYEITLTATNTKGSKSVTKQVVITEQAPEVAFSVSPATVLKGQEFKLTDESLYEPTAWQWKVTNAASCLVVNEQNPTVSLDQPGVYSVALTAENSKGTVTASKARALTVCNADGENGLNFYGNGEQVSFANPLAETDGQFTVEWWMYAKNNTENCHHIGGTAQDFDITTHADGSMSVSLGGTTVKTAADVVSTAEWHHYAVTYNGGVIRIFKDATEVLAQSVSALNPVPLPETFVIGGPEAPMNAVIDEMRIWNRALTADDFYTVSNQPVTDVAQAVQNGLKLYYAFNQNSGDVIDATPGQHNGTRQGFGPEGDAWSASLGIFCLSQTVAEDVTDQYLTNVTQPFDFTNRTVNYSAPNRFVRLNDWTIENAVENGSTTTGIHVDRNKRDAMTLTTTWDGFASAVADHKVYQTIELPAGYYRLTASEYQEFAASGSYLAAAAGEGLPNTNDLGSKALGYAPLEDRVMEFVVPEDGEVSVGMVFNLSGQSCITFSSFTLEKMAFRQIGDPTITGIEGPVSAEVDDNVQIDIDGTKVTLNTLRPERVRLFSIDGRCVFNEVVSGSRTLNLPAGIYIIKGVKFSVR